MNLSKLGSLEAIAFIIIVMLNNIVLNLPKSILNQCGSSSIINIIYISIIGFIFLSIVLKLFNKFKGYDILDIAEFLGGKIFKIIVGILFIIYFAFVSLTIIRNFSEMLRLTYFDKAPVSFIIICFIAVAVFANRGKRKCCFSHKFNNNTNSINRVTYFFSLRYS